MAQQNPGQRVQSYARLDFAALIVITVIVVLTIAVLAVAPVLAWQWARLPFPGFTVEPSLLASGTYNPEWEGFRKGLMNMDRLVAVDGQPVYGTTALSDAMRARRIGETVTFDFVEADTGQAKQLTLALVHFSSQDFVWFFVIPYLVGLSYLGIGLWVFRARYQEAAGRVFALMCCGVALATGLVLDLLTTHWLAWAWAASIPLAAGAMIGLSLLFPQEQRLAARWHWLRWVPYLPTLLLAISSWVTTYNTARPWAYIQFWHYGYYYGGMGLAALIGMTAYRRYFSPSPIVRRQSRAILWGAFISFLPFAIFVTRVALNIRANFIPWLYMPPMIVFPLAIAYSILRHRVMDIDLAVSRGVSYAVLTGIIAGIYFLLIGIASTLLRSTVDIDNPWLIAIFVLAVALLLDPLRDRVQYTVDTIFHRGGVDYRASLQAFSKRLTELVESERVLEALYDEIKRSLHPTDVWIYQFDSRVDGYIVPSVPGLSRPPLGAARFPTDSPLVNLLSESRTPLYIQTDRPLPPALIGEQARLETLGAPLYIPLRGEQVGSEHQLVGWIAQKEKQSDQAYTNDDLDFLLALADQTALALSKVHIFTDLQRRLQELGALSLISQAVTFTLKVDDIFELIYTQSSKIIDASNFYIALYDDSRQMLQLAFYIDRGERVYVDDEWSLDIGLSGEVVRTGRPIVTEDYLTECEQRGVIPGINPGRAWVGLPLMSGDKVFGTMSVSSHDPDTIYTGEHLRFLQAVADQTASILEKSQLYREMEHRARQLVTLNEVGRTIVSTLDLNVALRMVIEKAAEILDAEAASLFMVDFETDELVFEVAMGGGGQDLVGMRMPKGKGIVGTVVETLEPTIVNNVAGDSRHYKEYDKSGEFITQSLIAVPMISKDRAIGVIEVLNKHDNMPFDEDDQNLLQAFAAQSAVAIENARLYTMTDEALATRVEELQTLQRIDRELNASLDVERALDVTVEWAMRTTGAMAGLIGTLTPEGDGMLLHAIQGYGEELERYRTEPWPLDQGVIGRVARLGFPNMIADVDEDPDYVAATEGIKSLLAVPVPRENRVIGVIALESDKPASFDLEDLNFVVRLADHAAIAITNSQLYEEVKRANEYKSEFVSVVAHELKLPMQNIKGYGDLLSKGMGGELTDMQKQFLGTIRSNVDRMNTLVSDLLDISRIETGRMRLSLKPTSIQDVVEDAVNNLKRTIEEKGQTIEVDMPEELPLVMGDKSRLIQILTNMVSNAHKYTLEGGHIYVQVQEKEHDGRRQVICAVKDNGVGIAPEDVARLGEKFFRASDHRVRDVHGHGLGLSIVKNLIQMHGGELMIESELGVGSTFSFNVPVAEGAGSEAKDTQ